MLRLVAALGLLALAICVSLVGPLLETRQRSPEGTARAYLTALSTGDVDAALAAVDPAARDALRERVAWQLGNRYEDVTVVLGRPSVIGRLSGLDQPAAWVVVSVEVTTITGERWRSASTASLVERDGVWYLREPLFA